jgi:hypothetical protein
MPQLDDVIMDVRSARLAGAHADASKAEGLAHILSNLLSTAAKSNRADAQLTKELEAMSRRANALGDQITTALGDWQERAMPFDVVRAEVVAFVREGVAA